MLIFANSLLSLDIAGIKVPDRIKISGTTLNMNGAGILDRIFVDWYIGALYLPNKTTDPEKVLEDDVTMELKIIILSEEVTGGKMKESVLDGFRTAVGSEKVIEMIPEIDAFIKVFDEDIKVGDIFDYIYIPEKGLQTFKNRKLFSTISGLEFKKGIYGIWLGEEPVKKNFKKALLGIK
jgi:hypothetical protein